MIVLGLGSNVGDRLTHLRTALHQLKQVPDLHIHQVSPVYQSDALLPDNAPQEWDQPYLNLCLRCETTLSPDDLLNTLKKIEWGIGRKPEIRHWGPRVMDIDILIFNDLILQSDRLTVPHHCLFERPFALWPLADVFPDWVCPLPGPFFGKTASELVLPWGSRYDGLAPFHTKQLSQRVDTPALVGILNITPNSFSDGGEFLHLDAALHHASRLVEQGAEIIDIGAESTAPHATLLNENEEWQRLHPILEAITQAKQHWLIPPRISLDTRHAKTAERALAFGMDWINDQSGLSDPAMIALLAATHHDIVIMHQLGLPASQQHVLPPTDNIIQTIHAWAENKIKALAQAGIARERLIIDPGIGFGKSPSQSLTLIKQANHFKSLGTRLLYGHSRKSFMTTLTPYAPAERDIETAAMAPTLTQHGVDYLRLHGIDTTARLLRVTAALSP